VNQGVLRKHLQNVGFEVHVANHGGEALEKIQQSSFWRGPGSNDQRINISLVLMDWEMPVMDGVQCTKQIRIWEQQNELIAHIPIVGVTANARSEQIATLLEAGMVSSEPPCGYR